MTEQIRRTDTAARIVAAPPGAVFRAFIDPAALAEWLPPAGMTGRVDVFEPRAGGRLRMTLTYAEAGHGKTTDDADVVEGTVVDVIDGERLVQDVVFVSDDPDFADTMRMTWSVLPAAGGSEVTIVCENVPPGLSKADHDSGLASTLENLAAFVEARR